MRETRVESGAVRGIACGWPSITAYYGIPYAAPPVNSLRWCPPQPPAAWDGVRDCARPGFKAPQLGVGKGSFYEKEFYPYEEPMDEDCLYLNIWTPAQTSTEKLPVLFWVHGGAFMTGYGHSAHFDGEPFARQGVILVTINYRLNVFGWMVHPALSRESAQGVSGNYGLLDQIAALDWVRRNIAAFGGDPEAITVAGQSAGAMSVQALISTPMTEQKIARAILQSGGGATALPDMRFSPLAEAEQATDLSVLGVASIEEARALPWETLLERWATTLPHGGIQCTPVVDGFVLPASLDQLARNGKCRNIPYLIGYTAQEGIPAPPRYDQFVAQMLQEYGPEQGAKFLALGPTPETYPRYSSQDHFTEHARAAAEAWALQQQAQRRAPVYLYCIDRQLPGDDRGAFHAADLWYVFKTLLRSWRPWEAVDFTLAQSCNAYWANFVRTGNPEGPNLPSWSPYTESSPYTMMLGDRIGLQSMPENPRISFRRQFLLHPENR